jgi:hypothetical protein
LKVNPAALAWRIQPSAPVLLPAIVPSGERIAAPPAPFAFALACALGRRTSIEPWREMCTRARSPRLPRRVVVVALSGGGGSGAAARSPSEARRVAVASGGARGSCTPVQELRRIAVASSLLYRRSS